MLTKLLSHSRYRHATVFVLITLTNVVIGLVNASGWLQPMEMKAYDHLLGITRAGAPPETRVCLVRITEQDIRQLGHWPPSDADLADLFQALLVHSPRAIGLDLYRDVAVPPGTERLRQLFTEHRRIIVNIFKMDGPGSMENPLLSGVGLATPRGFSDLPVDADGIVRRGLLFMDDGTASFTAFSLLLALDYLAPEGIFPEPAPGNPDFLKLGTTVLAPLGSSDGGYVNLDDGGYQILLDYSRAEFAATNFTEVVAGRVDPGLIRDTVVIIGVAAESVKDIFFVPVKRSAFSARSRHGIEVHAQQLSQLLRMAHGESEPSRFASDSEETLWMLFWGVLAGLAAISRRSMPRFVATTVEGFLLWGMATYVLFICGIWLPVMPALLSYLFCGGIAMTFMTFAERSDNKTILQIFSRHVSADVARMIMLNKDKILDGGRPISRKLTASVLFVDIRGFSKVAEGLEPQQLLDWLNGYLGKMTEIIISHQGVVNKYIGDAVMAIFGVPFARDSDSLIIQDAINAVSCALEIGAAVEAMNQAERIGNSVRVEVRIGVNTGFVVAGCVGNEQRMEYTVLGDTVNIASRLESMQGELLPRPVNRDWRLYVSEATWQRVGDHFQAEHVGRMELKGKTRLVDVYQVVGRR